MADHGHSHDSHGHGTPEHGSSQHGGHDDMSHHVRQYIKVFVALCVLTTLSFFTYSDFFQNTFPPAVGWAFMMCVSCCKALLVMMFFMHLKYEADWKYVLTIPASIMSVFLALALVPDIGMRIHGGYGYGYSDSRFANIATPATQKALEEASLPDGKHGAAHGSEKGPAAGGSH